MAANSSGKPSRSPKAPLHFVGIGGSGMSALAELAYRRGMQVQGSDAKESVVTERLVSLGIPVSIGHAAIAVETAGTVIHSTAIDANNAELVAAHAKQLSVMHRSELLAELMRGKRAVTVAGTHGKSTTSAMIVHMLESLGVDPEAVLGGAMRQHRSAARAGAGDVFVAEADESDGSFLRYEPFIAVVTNVDQDHLEFFGSTQALERAFAQHLSRIDPDGAAVVGWDSPLARQAAANVVARRLAYGFLIGCDVRGFDYRCGHGETTFSVMVERDRISCRLPTIGKHNAQNALAALAVARALDLDVRQAAEALASFPGVERRMNLVHKSDDLIIFDDYAHNPGKIDACVRALRDSFKERQLHVIYQPHRYSRLETMYDDMLNAVSSADLVHVLPVYAAGETSSQDFSPGRLAADLADKVGVRSIACESLEAAAASVIEQLRPPAVALTVGAGDVWKAARILKDRLE